MHAMICFQMFSHLNFRNGIKLFRISLLNYFILIVDYLLYKLALFFKFSCSVDNFNRFGILVMSRFSDLRQRPS